MIGDSEKNPLKSQVSLPNPNVINLRSNAIMSYVWGYNAVPKAALLAILNGKNDNLENGNKYVGTLPQKVHKEIYFLKSTVSIIAYQVIVLFILRVD